MSASLRTALGLAFVLSSAAIAFWGAECTRSPRAAAAPLSCVSGAEAPAKELCVVLPEGGRLARGARALGPRSGATLRELRAGRRVVGTLWSERPVDPKAPEGAATWVHWTHSKPPKGPLRVLAAKRKTGADGVASRPVGAPCSAAGLRVGGFLLREDAAGLSLWDDGPRLHLGGPIAAWEGAGRIRPDRSEGPPKSGRNAPGGEGKGRRGESAPRRDGRARVVARGANSVLVAGERWLATGKLRLRWSVRAFGEPEELHLSLHLVARSGGSTSEPPTSLLWPGQDGVLQASGFHFLRPGASGGSEGRGCSLASVGRGERPQWLPIADPSAGRLDEAKPRFHGVGLALDDALEEGEGVIWRLVLTRGGAEPRAAGWVLPKPKAARAAAVAAWPRPLIGRVRTWLDDERAGLRRKGRDAGDWSPGGGKVGNGEYDTPLGLFRLGQDLLEARLLLAARAARDHARTRDLDAFASGLRFAHGFGHRDGGLEAGHSWVEGDLLLAQSDPDGSLDRFWPELSARRLAWLADCDLEREYPRSLGWGLLGLAAEQEHRPTPERRREIRRRLSDLVRRKTGSGFLSLRRGFATELNPYVQGGIVLPALVRAADQVAVGGSKALASGLARAVQREAFREDELGRIRLVRRIRLEEGGRRVAGTEGMAPGEDAALVLAGLYTAKKSAAEDSRSEAKGVCGTWRLERLAYPGRELSVLLRSGAAFGVPPLR